MTVPLQKRYHYRGYDSGGSRDGKIQWYSSLEQPEILLGNQSEGFGYPVSLMIFGSETVQLKLSNLTKLSVWAVSANNPWGGTQV